MEEILKKKLRHEELKSKVVSPEEAAAWITDGMVLGMSGFTRAGDVKVVPLALVEKAKTEKFKVDVFTGASLGPEVDQYMAQAGIIRKRGPFQGDAVIRNKINTGDVTYVDAHLSHNAELVRQGIIGPIDFAIIEATAITEDGYIIPTTSVGNSPIFVQYAKEVIIELNVAQLDALEGVHDIYVQGNQGERGPIPLLDASDRIGEIGIKVDPAKVRGIVLSDTLDAPSLIVPADEET